MNTLESSHCARIYLSWALQARQPWPGSPAQKVSVIAELGGLCSFPGGNGREQSSCEFRPTSWLLGPLFSACSVQWSLVALGSGLRFHAQTWVWDASGSEGWIASGLVLGAGEEAPRREETVWVAFGVYPHLRPRRGGRHAFVSVPFEGLAGIRPLLRSRQLHWTLVRLSPLVRGS